MVKNKQTNKNISKAVQMREGLPLEKIRQEHEDRKGKTMCERPQKVSLTRGYVGGTGTGGNLLVLERNWSCLPRGIAGFILRSLRKG